MASNFMCTLFLFFCLLLMSSSFRTSYVNSLPLPQGSSDKVSLGIYYESLDPESIEFIVYSLQNMVESQIFPIIDLHFSPWGNARLLSNTTFECQGGEKECLLNTMEACAIDIWPEWEKHFTFILCIEFMAATKNFSQWETCFRPSGFDRATIDECINSGLGTKLELKYAEETKALKPPLEYTPWVVVDGKPLYKDFGNWMSYICKAYKGSSPPEVCKILPSNTTTTDKAKKANQVSHRKDAAKTAKFPRSMMIQA